MSLIFEDENQKQFKAPIELWNLIISYYLKIEPTQPPPIARTSFVVLKSILSLTSKRFHQFVNTLTRNIKVDPAPLAKGSVVSYCCLNDYAQLLRYVIDIGATIGFFAVDEAARSGSLECLKVLEERGDFSKDQKNRAMNEASRHAHIHIVKYLVQRGVTPTELAVRKAIISGSIELVKYFQSLNVIEDYKGLGYFASESGNLSMVKFIEQYTPLEQSCVIASARSGSIEILEYLLAKGFRWEKNCCIEAFERGHAKYAKHALNHGPSMGTDLSGLIESIVKKNELDLLKHLGWELCHWDDRAIYWAVCGRNFEMFKYLIDNFPSGHSLDLGEAISLAVREGLLDFVKYMIEHGTPMYPDILQHAVESSNLDVVKYVVEKGAPLEERAIDKATNISIMQYLHERGCQWTTRTLEKAARRCDLELVQYLHENGCPWQGEVIIDRTIFGNDDHGLLQMVKYLHEQGCQWTENTANYAARLDGNMDLLQHLVENHCPLQDDIIDEAIVGNFDGVLPFVKYLHEQGCKWSANTCALAAERDLLTLLKYLHEHGCPWDGRTCAMAAEENNISCLEYALDNGCAYDPETLMNNAVHASAHTTDHNAIKLFECLLKRGIPWTKNTCALLIEYARPELLKFAHENEAPWTGDTITSGLQADDEDEDELLQCIQYAVANGCPWDPQEAMQVASTHEHTKVVKWIRNKIKRSGKKPGNAKK